jgi:hypothetical protein
MSLIVSLIAAIVLDASPSPTPLATGYGLLPVIVDVHTSAVCTTLRQTVIPVGFIAKTNDAAFTDVKNRTLKVGMSQIADQTDLVVLAHHDQVDTGAVTSNIALAKTLLDESRKRYPDEKDPEIAAMRAELESVIDLQRQYGSIVDAIAGAYLDSQTNQQLYGGMYGSNTASVQERNLQAERDFINGNRILLGLQPLDAPPLSASLPGSSTSADIADQLRQDMNATTQTQPVPSPGVRQQVDAQQLDEQLGLAESRLRATAVAALRLCSHAK